MGIVRKKKKRIFINFSRFTSGFHRKTIFSAKLDKKSAIDVVMRSAPFSSVYHQIVKLHEYTIKLCYASRTIFGDYILLTIICTQHHSNVNIVDWEFRTSSESSLNTLLKNDKWFRVLTTGMTILQPGSVEMDNFNLFSNVRDDLRISIPISYQIEESKLNEIYFERWKELKSK